MKWVWGRISLCISNKFSVMLMRLVWDHTLKPGSQISLNLLLRETLYFAYILPLLHLKAYFFQTYTKLVPL